MEIEIVNKPLVYTAMSKHFFYFRMFVSAYVLEQDRVPLNSFMAFDYFLVDAVNRNKVREADDTLLARADEVWVFGSISAGVLAHINLAKKLNKPVKYFKLSVPHQIVEADKNEMEFEDEVKEYKGTL